MSFLAVAAEHPLAAAAAARDPEAAEFVAECRRMGTSEAAIEQAEKRGFDTGFRVAHPFLEGATFPVWIANFVLMEYGTGAIFGCPAHDQRDLDFARKYGLGVMPVVLPPGADPASFALDGEAYTGDGTIFNSDFLDGLDVAAAKRARDRARWRRPGQGTGVVNWRLRDWGVSPPALLGLPDPGHPLRGLRRGAGAGRPAAGEAAGGRGLLEARQSAGPPPDLEARGLPALRQAGAARDRHLRHLRRQLLVLRPLLLAAGRGAGDARRRSMPGCRWTSISAASSTRSCTCSTAASSPARMQRRPATWRWRSPSPACSPRAWCTHESYKARRRPLALPGGGGVQPARRTAARSATLKGGNAPVTIGRVEAMSKSKRNTVDPGAIIDRYGADTARWFILSDNPPERDMEWTESRRRRRLPLHPAGLPPGRRARCRPAAGRHARPEARGRGAQAAPGDAPHHRRGDRGAGELRLQRRRRPHP